jgi:hypothetical protein
MPDEDVLPGFDAVQHMREARDRISRDIEGMTYAEMEEYFRSRLRPTPDEARDIPERVDSYRAGELKTYSADEVFSAGEELLRSPSEDQ